MASVSVFCILDVAVAKKKATFCLISYSEVREKLFIVANINIKKTSENILLKPFKRLVAYY